MKNFQRNLFIVLAIGLCGACVYQWYLQSVQLSTIERLDQIIYQKSADIQGYTNSIKTMDAEISQLHDRITQLKQAAVSNGQWAVNEKREVARLRSAGDILSNEIVEYKAAVDNLTNKLKKAYDGEKELVAQRDDFVKKLNQSIQAQNDLTAKYNELVDRFNKLQTTNAPPK
jgi:chromosome segregation ATPase